MFKTNKYKNKKTTIDGYTFDSKFEAAFYLQLKIREKAGRIKILELQPKVYLTKAKILFKPDFLIEENGKKIWIDVKGFAAPVFNIKKRLWKHYGPGELQIVYRNKIDIVDALGIGK